MPITDEELQGALLEFTDVPEEDITIDHTLEDLGIDSRDLTHLLIHLEERFDIKVDADEVARFRTVGELYNYVRARAD